MCVCSQSADAHTHTHRHNLHEWDAWSNVYRNWAAAHMYAKISKNYKDETNIAKRSSTNAFTGLWVVFIAIKNVQI